MNQRLQRQAEPERRVAGHEKQLARARRPPFAGPAARRGGRRIPALHGQDVTDGLAQAALEDAREPRARHRIVEAVRSRVEILGQLLFLADEMPRILVRRGGGVGVELQARRHAFQELPRVICSHAVVVRFLRNQLVRAPQSPCRRAANTS